MAASKKQVAHMEFVWPSASLMSLKAVWAETINCRITIGDKTSTPCSTAFLI